jgi:uncharacterized protein YjeT (DUF2065 family)
MIPTARYGRGQTRNNRAIGAGEGAIKDVVFAIGLLLAFEGLLFAAFPSVMRRAMEEAAQMSEQVMRLVGVGSAIFGIALLWAVRMWLA